MPHPSHMLWLAQGHHCQEHIGIWGHRAGGWNRNRLSADTCMTACMISHADTHTTGMLAAQLYVGDHLPAPPWCPTLSHGWHRATIGPGGAWGRRAGAPRGVEREPAARGHLHAAPPISHAIMGCRHTLPTDCSPLSWWMEYADRKNHEDHEHVSDSLLYDERCHLPRTTAPPPCVERIESFRRSLQSMSSSDD